MTKKLYLEDPYVTSFEAEILETRDLPEGTALVLDATHFYPESGGQPYDLGTIDGIAVTKVLESEDDTILHFVEKRPESAQVHCEVDSARRRDHMQQHSGQHVLSAAFVREAGAETTSFHLGTRISTIDLDKFPLSDEELYAAERAANDVVTRAVPIKSRFVSGAEALTLVLRKTPPTQDSIRIVAKWKASTSKPAAVRTHARVRRSVRSSSGVTKSSKAALGSSFSAASARFETIARPCAEFDRSRAFSAARKRRSSRQPRSFRTSANRWERS